MHIKVLRKVNAANGIGNHPQRTRRDHHGHDRKAVQTIGKVYGIGRPNNHEHREGNVNYPEIYQHIFENRHCQLI